MAGNERRDVCSRLGTTARRDNSASLRRGMWPMSAPMGGIAFDFEGFILSLRPVSVRYGHCRANSTHPRPVTGPAIRTA